jgi:type I restriction enzyme S subunit
MHYDVLLYKDGGKPGEFKPRVGMFAHDFPFPVFCINEHVFRMRSDKLGQHFLYFLISDQRVLTDFANKGGKAAIPGINQPDVKSTLFVNPPREIISEFNRRVSHLCDRIIRNALENKSLDDLRDTLIPRLLSGEKSPTA